MESLFSPSPTGRPRINSVVVTIAIIMGAIVVAGMSFGTTYVLGKKDQTAAPVVNNTPAVSPIVSPLAAITPTLDQNCARFTSLRQALAAPRPESVCYILQTEPTSVISREIRKFENLQSFVIAGQGRAIKTLPGEIGELKHLETLMISNTQISIVPPEIGFATNLKKLVLDNNQITTLPPEISQLTNLETLSLEGNPISSKERIAIQQAFPDLAIQF